MGTQLNNDALSGHNVEMTPAIFDPCSRPRRPMPTMRRRWGIAWSHLGHALAPSALNSSSTE